MKKLLISLLCLLCCLSLLTGCSAIGLSLFARNEVTEEKTPVTSDSVTTRKPEQKPDWAQKIREELLGEGTAVENVISNRVTLEVSEVTDSTVEVEVSAPNIYDTMVDWYTQTPEAERTEEAIMEQIENEMEHAAPETRPVILEIVIIDTKPHIIYTEEFLQWISCGLRWFFLRFEITVKPGFCQPMNDLTIDFASIEHEILLQTLMTQYYDSLTWVQADADFDGTKELLMEFTDYSTGRPTQMLLDTDTDILWSYTTTGAAQFTGFLEVDGRWAFENTYATAGTELFDLYFWSGEQWDPFASYHAEVQVDANGDFQPVVSVSQWNGAAVEAAEFTATWEQHCAVPEYDAKDLHVQTVLGDWEQLVSKMDRYLTDHHSMLVFERTDFTGDGTEDCVCILRDAANQHLANLHAENILGSEVFLSLQDEAYTVIGMEQTANGANITITRIFPSGTYDPNIMEHFYIDEEGALCFGDASRYIYVPEYGSFAEDLDLSGMDSPAADGVTLLDLLRVPEDELQYYLTDLTNYGGGYIEGYLNGVPVTTTSDYNESLGTSAVHTIHVSEACSLPIDANTHMGMTLSQIWEGIFHTEVPWMEVQAVQIGYAASVYYYHPSSGERYRIDLLFDGMEDSANITGISIMPW